MNKKVLVAYATKYGSTAEVAERIGQILSKQGITVAVSNVKDVRSITDYQAIILGGATRMDKILSDTIKFGRKFANKLQDRQTAFFLTGVTMKEDTAENRAKAHSFLQPLLDIKEPVSVGLFAGKLDYSKIGFVWKAIAAKDETGFMAEGDFRDWEKIEAWAHELIPLFVE